MNEKPRGGIRGVKAESLRHDKEMYLVRPFLIVTPFKQCTATSG